MFRRTIFWLHLGTGVTVGLVIAMMSLTGVLLTYELQLTSWADRNAWPSPDPGARRLSVPELVAAANTAGVQAMRLTFVADGNAPVRAGGGRRDPSTYIDAYSGAALGEPSNGMRSFMSTMTSWHRHFDAEGDARDVATMITGVSNLAFLFLAVTGAYLWLPKVVRWPLFRERLRFAKSYRHASDRDFYWHHIFGIWSLVPLIVVIATAVVFSFGWANDLVFKLAGSGAAGDDGGQAVIVEQASGDQSLSTDQLLEKAMSYADDWQSIAIVLPEADSRAVTFEVDTGTGRQPQKRDTLILDASSGEVVDWQRFAEQPAGNRARAWIRFLHTGEALGIVGQTIAGVVSLASLFMVWTGFALAWRRLIRPLFRAG